MTISANLHSASDQRPPRTFRVSSSATVTISPFRRKGSGNATSMPSSPPPLPQLGQKVGGHGYTQRPWTAFPQHCMRTSARALPHLQQ